MGREEEQVKVSILRDGGGARGGGPSAHGEDIYQGRGEDEALSVPNPWHHSVWPKTGALSASVLRHKGGLPGHPMGRSCHELEFSVTRSGGRGCPDVFILYPYGYYGAATEV